jgi:hypothetical protein
MLTSKHNGNERKTRKKKHNNQTIIKRKHFPLKKNLTKEGDCNVCSSPERDRERERKRSKTRRRRRRRRGVVVAQQRC